MLQISMDTVHLVKAVIAASGIGCGALLYVAHRNTLPHVRRAVIWMLVPLAIASLFAYANLGRLLYGTRYLNTYDVYHYYMGAKYFDELGYRYLYDATIVAAHEGDSKLAKIGEFRDQRTYDILPAGAALERQYQWRPRFSAARWEQFKADLFFFTPRMTLEGWRDALRDKGYNPPPVWTLLGGFVARHIPARPGPGMVLLAHLDVVFILLMLAAIWWAFDVETALVAAVFFGINYATPYSTIGGAFLRLDWLMWLVLSICLMKRNLPFLSGASLAYAALLRLSPAVYAFGLAAVAVHRWARRRSVPAHFWRFCAGGAIASAMLIGLTMVSTPRPVGAWREFGRKMALHSDSLGTKRYGLKYLFVWNGETTRDDLFVDDGGWEGYDARKHDRLERLHIPMRLVQLILVVLTALAASKREPWEAIALGSVLVFTLLSPTRYYYAQLITLAPLLVYQWPNRRRLVGFGLLFAMMVVAFAVHETNSLLAFMQFVVSAELLAFFLYLLISMAFESEATEAIDVSS